MKVAIEEVESVLLQKKIEPQKVAEIIRELEGIVEELSESTQEDLVDPDGLPSDSGSNVGTKQKWEHVIILHDKEGYLKNKEIAGWVVQQQENSDAGTILTRLQDAAVNQNEAAKRKKNRIVDFVGLFESLKSKFTKDKKVKIKTKDLTRVLITNGKFLSTDKVSSDECENQ